MKKLLFALVVSVLLVASGVGAADVVITITIPDAYVARVAAAIEGELMCSDGDNPKVCLTKHIINDIKMLVKGYERKINTTIFDNDFVEPEVQ